MCIKFRLLAQSNDIAGTGAQLKTMYELFPDNAEVRSALIGWYLVPGRHRRRRGLPARAGRAADRRGRRHIAVVQLLQRARGTEAAQAELDAADRGQRRHAKADLPRACAPRSISRRASRTEAIAALEEILRKAATLGRNPQDQDHAGPDAGQRPAIRVGARARVEEVLVEDPTNVEALKMRAGWLIEEDKPGEAIVDLRAALGQAPRDADDPDADGACP